MADADTAPTFQRPLALLLLVGAGLLSLPVAALALDGESTDGLVVPAQLAGMALVGALVGYLLPGLAGGTASKGRSALIGAAVGLLVALLGIVVFLVLLDG